MGVGFCFGTLFILVGGIPTPLKNMSSSVGMKFPIYGKKNVPNHQPDIVDNMGFKKIFTG